ncbi:MAG TPA: hypothetical protein QF549_00340 [Candidatus Saccharimonadaceae bacterium]|nr:hypothetical protein [Candidatus Saccharimonadaceae bacterium]
MGGFLHTRERGYAIKDIAKKLGLLYFGSVDHRNDDHEVIRGLTVSMTHKDRHYAVGSYDGYDIALVDRYDTNVIGRTKEKHNWAILQVTLHPDVMLPHIFVLPHDRTQRFQHLFLGLRQLQVIHGLTQQDYHAEFTQRYNMYAAGHQAPDVEQIITSDIARGIAARFWPHAIEIRDDKLFIYLTEHRLSQTVLGGSIEAALWLAETLDKKED